MKVIKTALEHKEIKILPLSDVHIGDKNINLELLKQTIKYIKNNANVYTVLNGDIFNQATKDSVSFEHGATSPSDEYEQALELFKPIADKILLITLGNHDDRVTRATGIDVMKFFARDLGCEEVYCGYQGILIVQNKWNASRNRPFKLYFTHGIGLGGGRTASSKINGVKRLAETVTNADVYCMGHVHVPIYMTDVVKYVDDKHYNPKLLTRHFLITPSFLNHGGYGEKFNYAPTSQEQIEVVITNNIAMRSVKL